MSRRADIKEAFEELLSKGYKSTRDVLACKFAVFEALDWEESCGDVVREMLANGIEIDGNMRCYLDT